MRQHVYLLALSLFLVAFATGALAKRRPTRRSHPAAHAASAEATVSTPGYDFTLHIGGLFQTDAMYFGGAPQLQGNSNWREGKPYLAINFTKKLSFFFSYEMVEKLVDDVFFEYDINKQVSFVAGQYSPIWGLVNSDDTSTLNFLELPLPYGAFSPTHGLGGQVELNAADWWLTLAEYSTRIGVHYPAPQPIAKTFNLLYAPIFTQYDLLALVLSGWEEPTDGSNTFNFAAIPEIQAHNIGALIGTGNITNAKNFWIGNLGAVWQHNSFTVESEYEHDWISRADALGNLNFDGYYVNASYILTGERRVFSPKFSGYVGISPLQHRYGAWQISTQFSYLNLSDRNIYGGNESNLSFDVNWYPAKHLKYQAMYIHSWATPNSFGVAQQANFFGFRMQLVF